MLFDVSRLKVVTLNCPYDQWSDPVVRDLFCKIIALKLKGYGASYPYGVMPIDTSDFVGVHFAVCDVGADGELRPLMAYKAVDRDRCLAHNLTFPALTLARYSDLAEYERTVQAALREAERRGVNISYDSSWTVDPKVRENRALAALLKKFMTMFMVNSHLDPEWNVPMSICMGVPRFKTDGYFTSLGYEQFNTGGEPLPGIPLPPLHGELAVMFLLKEFTKEALATAAEMSAFWQDRLALRAPVERVASKKAA